VDGLRLSVLLVEKQKKEDGMFEELIEAKILEESRPIDLFPTLYKVDKHKSIRIWRVWTEGDDIVTSFGTLDGQEQVARKKAEPKNVGQKNETTGSEQALLEAASMHKKQQDKGYRLNVAAAKEYILLPMLAQKFEDKKSKLKYPVLVQPKLDGVRCLAYWGEDGIELISRKGKPYNVPHIKKQLEAVLPVGRVFDGELYLHGATFQEVTRLVKKLRPETKTIEYWIYDTFEFYGEDTPCKDRIKYLESLENLPENIKVVETFETSTEQGVYDFQCMFVSQGFEGAIVRCPDAPYEVGHRSNSLLKVKSFLDGEYKVIGFDEGVGKNKGCVTWTCEVTLKPAGLLGQFNVTPKGTYQQKKEWYSTASSYIGKWLTVKYFELSEDGVPRFPIGLGFRTEEDLPDNE
jgi:DNA ligase-1